MIDSMFIEDNDFVPLTMLEEIAQKLTIQIVVHEKSKDVFRFNKKEKNIIELAMWDEHYFLYDKMCNITQYALNNYDEVKDMENYHLLDAKNTRRDNRSVNSLTLVKFLVDNKDKFLTQILNEEAGFIRTNKIKKQSFDMLDVVKENFFDSMHEVETKDGRSFMTYDYYQAIKYRAKNNDDEDGKKGIINVKEIDQVHFDIESTTDGAVHEAYLLRSYQVEGETFKFINKWRFDGEDCGLKLLRSLTKDTILFAHNLGGYDLNFIFKYLFADNIVDRKNKIFGGSSLFHNIFTGKTITVYLKDTYLMLGSSLRACPKTYFTEEERKTVKKEVYPYKAYTRESVKLDHILIKDAKKHLKKRHRDEFLKNIDSWGCRIDAKTFDHIKYANIYCEQDVNVQYKSYMKLREWILEITGLDIINYLTISSVAYDFMKKEGCLDGCYNMTGMVRDFIQQTVVGGRCMISENKMAHIREKIEDLDAASLYPSAMRRLSFLLGMPKVLKTKNYEEMKKYDGFFVEINITKIGIKRKFPLMSKMNDEGVRMFENKTGTYYVDNIALEDMIKFQKIEFEVVRGFYFNSGVNDKVKEFIKNIYDIRAREKKAGNQIESVYKLLMNSCYGKSILTNEENEVVYKSGSAGLQYIARNFELINNYTKIEGCDKYRIVKNKVLDDHFSAPHVGSQILSMSKRIMNEVMCLAEDMGIPIHYQDTDSMHIEFGRINELRDEFKKIYDRELIGSDMGQFKSDFDYKSDEVMYAVESIFLAKKCYIDKIKTVRNGVVKYHYHYRMKGIPSNTISKYFYDNYEKDKAQEYVEYDSLTHDKKAEKIEYYEGNYMKLYRDLYKGEEVTFNLLDANIKFQKNKNFTIETRKKFDRTVFFIEDKKEREAKRKEINDAKKVADKSN